MYLRKAMAVGRVAYKEGLAAQSLPWQSKRRRYEARFMLHRGEYHERCVTYAELLRAVKAYGVNPHGGWVPRE